jgi:hypothetical protein
MNGNFQIIQNNTGHSFMTRLYNRTILQPISQRNTLSFVSEQTVSTIHQSRKAHPSDTNK